MTLQAIPFDGEKISEPGLYSKVPMDIYHGDLCTGVSVSSTGLRKIFHESPADFYDGAYFNPDREPEEDNQNFILGRAVHHLILGENFFAKMFVQRPDTYIDPKTGDRKPWNGNAIPCKQWLEENKPTGRGVLLRSWIDDIKGMAIALGKDPLMQTGVLKGQIERTLVYKDRKTGIWVKVRPDAIPTDSGDAADLKTTTSVQWTDLRRTIADFAYYQQAALVRSAFREVLNVELTTFTYVFVQKKRPYSVRNIILKESDLDLGEKCNDAALALMWRSLNSKQWPGPGGMSGDVAESMEITEYARDAVMNRMAQIEMNRA